MFVKLANYIAFPNLMKYRLLVFMVDMEIFTKLAIMR